MGDARQIVAFGGGGFSMERDNTLMDDYVLGLADASRPRVCFLPTASGDADHYIVRFYRAFDAARCEPSHVSLFRRDSGAADIHQHIFASDIVYVGGGSVLSLLGAWRAQWTASGSCRSRTACTSTASAIARAPSAGTCSTGWSRGMPPRTAPRCTSPASGSRASSPHARAHAPTGCGAPTPAVST